MTHIAICLPSMGTHEAGMSLALAAMAAVNAKNGIAQSFLGWQQAGIAKSRNTLVRAALDANADYLMWIDADLTFPPDAVLRLLARSKHFQSSIVGCAYPMREPPYPLIGRPKDPSVQNGLSEFHWLPSGFMLVEAIVYRNISRPWYFETYAYDGDETRQIVASVMDNFGGPITDYVGSISTKYLPTDDFFGASATCDRSEDVNFCRKLVHMDFPIMCDLDLTKQIAHIGKHAIQVGG